MYSNLAEFHEAMPNGMDSISVDIVGFCNAKCKYCPAGACEINNDYISVERFESIIERLIEYGFYNKDHANFQIYCLGEPCLHPEINDILRVLVKHGVHTAISTNASKVPDFAPDALQCVDRFLISMPGFSQESYDKIHGFKFDQIRKNIIRLRKQVSDLTNNGIPFDMTYHIYQFNEAEMVPAKEFCDQYDIRFAPNYAVLIDKDRCFSYVTDQMPYAELKEISKDLFLGVLDRQIRDAPRDYCDFQNGFLSINIDGDIRICSSYSPRKEKDILIGNILTDDIDDILYRKTHFDRCDACIKAGLTLSRGNDCKVFPDGYFDIMRENEFIKNAVANGRTKDLDKQVRLLKMIRAYEAADHPVSERSTIISFAADNGLDGIVPLICKEFVRFPKCTLDRLTEGQP